MESFENHIHFLDEDGNRLDAEDEDLESQIHIGENNNVLKITDEDIEPEEEPEINIKVIENLPGINPREVVQQLEGLAAIKTEAEYDLLSAYDRYGQIRFYGNKCVASLKDSPYGLRNMEIDIANRLHGKLDDVEAPQKVRDMAYNLGSEISTKRWYVENIREAFSEISDEDVKGKNAMVARTMFRELFPDKEVPDDLYYVESPVGLVFAVKDTVELNKLYTDIGGDRRKSVAGFATTGNFKRVFDGQEGTYDVQVHFQPALKVTEDTVELDAGVFRHELQHSIDRGVMKEAADERISHLRAEGSSKRSSRIEVAGVSDSSKFRGKSEIFAFNESEREKMPLLDF